MAEFVFVTHESKAEQGEVPAHDLDWLGKDEDGPVLQTKATAMRDALLAAPPPPQPTAGRKTAVEICARSRPLLDHERARLGARIEGASASSHAQFDYEAVVAVGASVFCLGEERKIGAPTGELSATQYTLHAAFAPESSSEEVYARSVAPLVQLALRGGMGSVIAYGQTGSGKTHTMRALQQLAADELFAAPALELRLSFFENAGERCTDLLDPRAPPLALREDAAGDVVVVGLTEHVVTCAREFARLLADGNERRLTKATRTNDTSSRSHAICTLRLPGAGVLRLVDLAGSERREDAVDHEPARVLEMREINGSLGTLKECIRANVRRALGERNAHIPYRNSKLTMLLRAVFEGAHDASADGGAADGGAAADGAPRSALGSSEVCFIAHVSPLRSQAKHTTSTLDYAAQMLQATRAEQQRAEFDGVEKWSSQALVKWVVQLDGGAYAHCALAFSRCSGKMLAVEYLPDVAQWVVAAGGTLAEAEAIYEAFRALLDASKRAAASLARKNKPADKAGKPPGRLAAFRAGAAARAGAAGAGTGGAVAITIVGGQPEPEPTVSE